MAILLHEIPHEVGDFAILLRAGFDRWSAAKLQLSTALGGLLGAGFAICTQSPKGVASAELRHPECGCLTAGPQAWEVGSTRGARMPSWVFFSAAEETAAWVLPFTSGGFLYIALVNVLPDLLEEEDPW
ncbi:hypothetical protein P7K49_021821 [Saguinus oedipus]|uniref:Zinc transporter ZIP13 n=1 Tax=Saguinus oedipus TaxID=9490 RepID=A0ABQ9UTP2_SAGOE|nr:hypothetical protein P7K49_021821 [Saguinus oedipus]